MPAPVLAPTAAAPLLWLGLQKIARTPRPRLAVGYKIICRNRHRHACGRDDAIKADPSKLPLGARLRLERFLAGGIVGETLPMSLFNMSLFNCRPPAIGARIDMVA